VLTLRRVLRSIGERDALKSKRPQASRNIQTFRSLSCVHLQHVLARLCRRLDRNAGRWWRGGEGRERERERRSCAAWARSSSN
jgi:hypothetical protein